MDFNSPGEVMGGYAEEWDRGVSRDFEHPVRDRMVVMRHGGLVVPQVPSNSIRIKVRMREYTLGVLREHEERGGWWCDWS